MTDEELKNKCKERAKIFQQAMESCKSSSPMDCIEWFADRIAELEKENADIKEEINKIAFARGTLEEENAELKETITKMNNVITETFSKLTKAKELLEDLIRFQPYINKEAIFHSIGNEWKTAIYKAEQFLSEVEK